MLVNTIVYEEPILLQTGTSDVNVNVIYIAHCRKKTPLMHSMCWVLITGQRHKTINFVGQEVTGQGHRKLKLDLEAWWNRLSIYILFISSTSSTYSIGDWYLDGWMSSNFRKITTSAVFVRFLRNFAHMFCVPIRKKNLQQIFIILL